MSKLSALSLILAGTLLSGGCGGSEPAKEATPSSPVSQPSGHLDHALPRLNTIKLWIGKAEIEAEVARTAAEIQTGMMFRTRMPEDAGMLFVFPRPHRCSFYMKNVAIDLSCAYVSRDGEILEIHELKAGVEDPVEAGTDRIQFVLETAHGWFERHQIAIGTVISTPYGAFNEVNWGTLRPLRQP